MPKFKDIITRLKKKAMKSISTYKISAIGLNRKGEVIGTSFNRPRFDRHGGGIHAEMALMKKFDKGLKTIIICRVGGRGDLRPIDPCYTCEMKARQLGIDIISITPGNGGSK